MWCDVFNLHDEIPFNLLHAANPQDITDTTVIYELNGNCSPYYMTVYIISIPCWFAFDRTGFRHPSLISIRIS